MLDILVECRSDLICAFWLPRIRVAGNLGFVFFMNVFVVWFWARGSVHLSAESLFFEELAPGKEERTGIYF